ncbi:LCP family protein [Enterococcus sp. CWB-B31]|uniref:LCP family protein n=1 Tax=Enterococcus sp. CWB-B31 TaxID=2885159 RepID=UPI001E553341|nr:LCP family protein [Enterococcus sp. CWB-B31]MCB5955701.1 LCP family protein [Enterococcus sp. CWB-B31]
MKRKARMSIIIFLSAVFILDALGCYAALTFFSAKENAEATKNNDFTGDDLQNDKELTIMLIGTDTRDVDVDDDVYGGRSDTLMIAHYDTTSKQPKLISIMRDSYVNIPGYGYDKINSAYAYGGAKVIKEVINESFDLPINYYAVIDFSQFSGLIDELYPKGVSIDAEKDINLDGVDIYQGEQVMDGQTLLQYARFRMDEEGDFGRVRRQQQVMVALADQSKDLVPLLKLPKAAGKAAGKLDTNVPTDLIIDLAKNFLIGRVKPLEILSVPVEGSWNFNNYTSSGSVIEIDEAMNAQAIKEFLNGTQTAENTDQQIADSRQ